jgi:hypothetical protein
MRGLVAPGGGSPGELLVIGVSAGGKITGSIQQDSQGPPGGSISGGPSPCCMPVRQAA